MLYLQVQCLQVESEAMETSSQQDLERKMAGLKNEVQVLIMLQYDNVIQFVNETLQFNCIYFFDIVHGTYNNMFGGAAR